MIVIIAGPSGAGKTTMCRLLVDKMQNLVYSVSATTREKREGEKEGINYIFLSEEEFRDWNEAGKFIEVAKVHDSFYGTPAKAIKDAGKKCKDIVMDIDVQGAEIIKKKKDNVVSIFLMPPDMEEAIKRIKKRGSEDVDKIEDRMKTAEEELKEASNFDYIVINKTLEETIGILEAIITAERHSTKRMEVSCIQ